MKRRVRRAGDRAVECRDDREVVVRIPKRLLVEYVTEPVCFNQPRSSVRRYVDYLFHLAVWDEYIKLNAGSDADDPRG